MSFTGFHILASNGNSLKDALKSSTAIVSGAFAVALFMAASANAQALVNPTDTNNAATVDSLQNNSGNFVNNAQGTITGDVTIVTGNVGNVGVIGGTTTIGAGGSFNNGGQAGDVINNGGGFINQATGPNGPVEAGTITNNGGTGNNQGFVASVDLTDGMFVNGGTVLGNTTIGDGAGAPGSASFTNSNLVFGIAIVNADGFFEQTFFGDVGAVTVNAGGQVLNDGAVAFDVNSSGSFTNTAAGLINAVNGAVNLSGGTFINEAVMGALGGILGTVTIDGGAVFVNTGDPVAFAPVNGVSVIAPGGTVGAATLEGVAVTNAVGGIEFANFGTGVINNPAGDGVRLSTFAGMGDVSVMLGANVSGSGDAINVRTSSGNVVIGSTVDGLTVVGGTDPGDDGIDVRTESGNITINPNATITGDPGIVATSNAGGNITINGVGAVTGLADDGIRATSSNGDGVILVAQDGVVMGAADGVDARTSNAGTGTGTVTVTAVQAITGDSDGNGTGNGIRAATDLGLLTVNGDGAVMGADGILATTGGGAIDITGAGAVTAASNGASATGIQAVIGGAMPTTAITINRTGAITAGGIGMGLPTNAFGVVAINNGTSATSNIGIEVGDVTVNASGTARGIQATSFSTAAGSTLDVTLNGALETTGGIRSTGITTDAVAAVTTINLDATSSIIAAPPFNSRGILAGSVDGDINVLGDGFVTAGTTGIAATTTGAGNINITGGGIVTTNGPDGNVIVGNATGGGDVTINRSGLVTAVGASGSVSGIVANTVGDGNTLVTNNGGITLDSLSDGLATTFSGSNGISVLHTGGGTGTVTINGTGAISNDGVATSNGIIVASDSSGLIDIDNAAITLNTASNGAGVSATSTGGGIITVDNAGAINGGGTGIFTSTNGAGTSTVTTAADIGTGMAFGGGAGSVNIVGINTNTVDGNNTVNLNNTIVSDINGIEAASTGAGSVIVNHDGSITATNGIGVITNNTGTGSSLVFLNAASVIDAGNVGVLSSNSGPGVIGINTLAGATIEAGTTGLQTVHTGAGTTFIAHAGAIDAVERGIDASTTGTGDIDVELFAGATIDATTMETITTSATTGTTTINNNGLALVSTGQEAISATSTGGAITINNLAGGSIVGNINAIVGSAPGGAFDITNEAGSTIGDAFVPATPLSPAMNINGGGGVQVALADVATSDFLNAGVWNAQGSGSFFSGNITNNGIIDRNNARIGDTITAEGNFGGVGILDVDVDLGAPLVSQGVRVDQLVVNGDTAGADQSVNFTNIGFEGFIPNPEINAIVVVDVAGDSNPTDFTGFGLPTMSVIDYTFGQAQALVDGGVISGIGPNFGTEDFILASNLNIGALGGITNSILLSQSLIGTTVNRPSSAFVSGLAFETEPSVCGPGIWGRGVGGFADGETTTTTSSIFGSFGSASSDIDLYYRGLQGGIDLLCSNIEGTNLELAAGVFGGFNDGGSRQLVFSNAVTNGVVTPVPSITRGDFDQTYYGAYLTFASGPLYGDLQVRQEDTEFTFDNPMIGIIDQELDTDRLTFSGSVSYVLDLGEFDLTPTGGFAYSETESDSIAFASTINGVAGPNGNILNVLDYDTSIAYVGATLSTTKINPDGSGATNPFISYTAFNDFGDDPQAAFVPGVGNQNNQVLLTSDNIGFYNEIGAGVNYVQILQDGQLPGNPKQFSASIRVDFRFGDNVNAQGLTGQARLQF